MPAHKLPIIAFDVNGTLLDTAVLRPVLQDIFGHDYSAEHWFHEFVQYSMALTITGAYREFSDIAMAVLRMSAAARNISLTTSQLETVQATLRRLPAFPDVHRSLSTLCQSGFRLIALSNSAASSLEHQLRSAGILDLFEHVLSVDRVRRFKPAREVYEMAAKEAGVSCPEMLMVAAHPWDLMGAQAAGYRTAFVRRKGEALFPGMPEPDYSVDNLHSVCERLVRAAV